MTLFLLSKQVLVCVSDPNKGTIFNTILINYKFQGAQEPLTWQTNSSNQFLPEAMAAGR